MDINSIYSPPNLCTLKPESSQCRLAFLRTKSQEQVTCTPIKSYRAQDTSNNFQGSIIEMCTY